MRNPVYLGIQRVGQRLNGLGEARPGSYYDAIERNLGMQVQLGAAKVYPELVSSLNKIYADRISKLPFVPNNWLTSVMALQGTDDGLLLYPIKATNFLGMVNKNLPPWVQANAEAWDKLADVTKAALQYYLDGQIAEGRIAMNAAYANAAMWTSLYNFAKTVGAGADKALNILKPSKNLVTLAAIGAAVVGLYLWKKK